MLALQRVITERYSGPRAMGCLSYWQDGGEHVVQAETVEHGKDTWSFSDLDEARKWWAHLRRCLAGMGYWRA